MQLGKAGYSETKDKPERKEALLQSRLGIWEGGVVNKKSFGTKWAGKYRGFSLAGL